MHRSTVLPGPLLLRLDAVGLGMVALALAAFFALSFAVASASADTIVLKNGRRITAYTVVEAADKIKYKPPAGELGRPKSIVDQIKKGGAVAIPAAPGAD